MFVLLILIFGNCLCSPVLSAPAESQQLSHGLRTRQASNKSDESTNTPVTDVNIAFDLPDITATFKVQSGSVQLEGFKSVNNDKLMAETKSSQLTWVSIGHPHLIKTKNPNNSSEYQFFHSSDKGFTTYVQMMTEEQRRALATAARLKYRVDIGDNQVVHLVLSRFYCKLLLFDEAGRKYLIGGNVSDFKQLPLRLDFDALSGKAEHILLSKLIKISEDDLTLECNIESRGGKLIKSNSLQIDYKESQRIGLEDKLFGQAGNNAPNEVFVSRNQMFQLAHEMYSSLNVIEDYEMPETQFSDAFVNDFISQIATSQFTQTSTDAVLASISKYSFDISADLKPDTIKSDLGSFVTVNEIDGKERMVFHEKKYKEVEDKYAASGDMNVGMKGLGALSAEAAAHVANKEISATETLTDQMREFNSLTRNEAQWKREGNKIIPKSLNVARVMRSNMKKSIKFNRIRLQKFAAPFARTFKIYTSRLTKLECQNVSTPKVCPYGFDYFSEINECLYLNRLLMPWDDARNACARMKPGAQLVSIQDSAKQEAVRRYLQFQFTTRYPFSAKSAWMVGKNGDRGTCSSYFWKPVVETELPFAYTNWYENAPTCDGGSESCTLIGASTQANYQWEDIQCSTTLCSVCEF